MTAENRPRLIALIVACAMFMAQLDSTIILTALPRMAQSFHTSVVELSAGVTVYLLVQAALLPASGWVADRYGARRVFASAMVGFVVASVLCGFSRNLPEFIGARVLQAAAAALMTPVGRIVMLRSVDRRDLVRIMVIASTPMLVAPTIGPPLGGFITTYFHWSWVFFLNVPLGMLGVGLILAYIPDLKSENPRPFDLPGFILTGAAVAGLLYGVEELAGPDGAARGGSILAASTVAGLLAYRHLKRRPDAILSLKPFRSRVFTSIMIGGGALVRLPVRAAPFILPLLFQVGMGMSAFRAGLLLLFFNAGDLVLKPVVNATLQRLGFRRVLVVSAAVVGGTVALSATFGPGVSDLYIGTVLTVCGMFRSLLFTGLGAIIYEDMPTEEVAHGSVIWNMMQHVSNALGVSLAALTLHLSGVLRGAAAGEVGVVDCQVALLLVGLLGMVSAVSLARLPRDAGKTLMGPRGGGG